MKFRLGELRQERGLSRRDVHEATGVSMNTLLHYEKGGMPSIGQAEAIAAAYHVNPAWLLGWVDDDLKPESVEIVTEKVVYVEKNVGRLPPYWNNDCDGKLIRWKRSRRQLPERVVKGNSK